MEPGELFFLTSAYERYVLQRTDKLKVSLVNRIAKLEQIIDWDSESGKRIKDARIKSGKWKDLPLEDNKYIFSVYYHDLRGRNNQEGVIERGVSMFSKDPKTGEPFFIKMPGWIFKEIQMKCVTFEVRGNSNHVS
jgi:hypothetical protein